ncbi:hypothetical protein ACFE04_022573 [Oxalis oulophora]
MQSTKPHAILLASPGMGHLIPIIELGRTIVRHHNFEATIFVIEADSSVAESNDHIPNPDDLHIVSLPLVDISSLTDPSTSIGQKLHISIHESISNLRAAISKLNNVCRPVVLIVDLFGTEAFAIADEFQMLKYVFITGGAWFLAIELYMPHLDFKAKDDHVIRHKPLIVPGCEPVRFENTIDFFQDQTGNAFARVLNAVRGILTADGIMVNTFEDLEPSSIKALRDGTIFHGSNIIPVQAVGPLVREPRPKVSENHILSWLDLQPPKSVIYVSFGSGGTLSTQQLQELALGLELSQQRFVWVVRPPSENTCASFFDHIKVAVRLWPPPSGGVVTRDEIKEAVIRIMVDEEGEGIRNRMEHLKNMANKALSKGGSSFRSLEKFAHDCKINLQNSDHALNY